MVVIRFNIGRYGNAATSEPDEYTKQTVQEVRTCDETLVQADTIHFCGTVEHHPHLAWLVGMYNGVMR